MKIGDERKSDRISAKNWVKFFNDAGVGPAVARKRLEGLAQNVGKRVRGIEDSHPGRISVSPIVLGNYARVHSLGE